MTKYYQAMYKPVANSGGNLTGAVYSGWSTAPFTFDPVTPGDYLVGYMVWDDVVRTVLPPLVMPTVQAVGAAVTSNSTAAITLVPPAHVANDILVAVLVQRQSVAIPDLFGLYGWNILGSYGGTSSSHLKVVIAWKRATGTNSEGNLSYQPTTGPRAGVIFNIRGAKTTAAPILVGGNFTNTATTAISVNGGTTATDQNLILQAFCCTQAAGSGDIATGQANASLSSLVNQVEVGSGAAALGLYVSTGGKALAGTVDPLTATLGAAYSYSGVTVAFEAA